MIKKLLLFFSLFFLVPSFVFAANYRFENSTGDSVINISEAGNLYIAGSLYPSVSNTGTIGATSNRWSHIYQNTDRYLTWRDGSADTRGAIGFNTAGYIEIRGFQDAARMRILQSSNTVLIDMIDELTTDTGVTIEGTLLKDGKVGIGTATPSQLLHVAGSVNVTGDLYLGDDMQLIFGNDSDYNLQFTGTTFNIRQGGNARHFFDSGGNLQSLKDHILRDNVDLVLGTGSNFKLGFDSADLLLTDGTNTFLNITDKGSTANFKFIGDGNFTGDLIVGGTTIGGTLFKQDNIYLDGGEVNATGIDLTLDSDNDVIINPTGNVGIKTTAPTAVLEVNGSFQVTNESGSAVLTHSISDIHYTSVSGVAWSLSSADYLDINTGAGSDFNVDVGGDFSVRDIDDDNNVRFSIDSGTGIAFLNSTELTIGSDYQGSAGIKLKRSVGGIDAYRHDYIAPANSPNFQTIFGGEWVAQKQGTLSSLRYTPYFIAVPQPSAGDAYIRFGFVNATTPFYSSYLSTVLSIKGDGNVGIGTTTPGESLEIEGNLQVGNGNVGSAGIKLFRNNSGTLASTHEYFASSNSPTYQKIWGGNYTSENAGYVLNGNAFYLKAVPAGNIAEFGFIGVSPFTNSDLNPVITMLSSGNVGIGITSPSQELEIVGDINLSGNIYFNGDIDHASGHIDILDTIDINSNFLVFDGASTNFMRFVSNKVTVIGDYEWQDDDLLIFGNDTDFNLKYNSSSTNLEIGTATNRLISITTAGNVGIGTSNPESDLQIYGNSGQVVLKMGGNSSDGRGIITYDHTNNYLDLLAYKAGYGNVIVSNGNMGIGTIAPSLLLSTYGSTGARIEVTGGSGNVAGIQVVHTNTTTPANGDSINIALRGVYSLGNERTHGSISGVIEDVTDGTPKGALTFATLSSSGAVTEKLRITSTGNVGVGMTSPPYGLSINPGASQYALGLAYNSQSAVQWILGSNSAGSLRVYEEGVGDSVYITAGATSWTSASDERLKKNISNYDLGLSTIRQLQPRYFEWNGKYNRKADGILRVGMIAQEVLPILPRTVNSEYHDEYKIDILGVDPSEFTYLLINSVKELDAENIVLKETIMLQEERLTSLEKRLKELEEK